MINPNSAEVNPCVLPSVHSMGQNMKQGIKTKHDTLLL